MTVKCNLLAERANIHYILCPFRKQKWWVFHGGILFKNHPSIAPCHHQNLFRVISSSCLYLTLYLESICGFNRAMEKTGKCWKRLRMFIPVGDTEGPKVSNTHTNSLYSHFAPQSSNHVISYLCCVRISMGFSILPGYLFVSRDR